jgi:hypothetical protein
MSDFENDLPTTDELSVLKERADMMGLDYHPSIGVEKLRAKVLAAQSGEVAAVPEASEPKAETANAMQMRLRNLANELLRIRVSCMNPAKKEWEGELFTAGNSVVGSFTKFVPFNAEDGWHVQRIIYNQLKERQCQIFYTVKDSRGNNVRKGKLIKEFAIEILPNLTPEELQELAQRQAMAKSID